MRTIDWYVDKARDHAGIRSDRGVGIALGGAPQLVSHWRTKRAWPSDETMLKLADLAGEDPESALLDLAIWRTYDTPAGKIYQKMANKLKTAAAAFVIAILGVSGPAGAGTLMEQGNPAADKVCILWKIMMGFVFQRLSCLYRETTLKIAGFARVAYDKHRCTMSIFCDSLRRNVDRSALHNPAPRLCHV